MIRETAVARIRLAALNRAEAERCLNHAVDHETSTWLVAIAYDYLDLDTLAEASGIPTDAVAHRLLTVGAVDEASTMALIRARLNIIGDDQ